MPVSLGSDIGTLGTLGSNALVWEQNSMVATNHRVSPKNRASPPDIPDLPMLLLHYFWHVMIVSAFSEVRGWNLGGGDTQKQEIPT